MLEPCFVEIFIVCACEKRSFVAAAFFILLSFGIHLSIYEYRHHSSHSLKQRDACGVCGGNNATCTGCDGVPNSGKVVDSCGVCGGSCDEPFSISFVNLQTDYQSSFLYVAVARVFMCTFILHLFYIHFVFIFIFILYLFCIYFSTFVTPCACVADAL